MIMAEWIYMMIPRRSGTVSEMSSRMWCGVLVTLVATSLVTSTPLHHGNEEPSPLSELGGRVASRLQDRTQDRLGLPDLETIKKVAQILITIGEQVLPAIIGERPPCPGPAETYDDVTN